MSAAEHAAPASAPLTSTGSTVQLQRRPHRRCRLALAGIFAAVGHASPQNPTGSSSAFVHLFEWKWSDVAQECEEFLGPKGFQAVQISPPNDHISGSQWWTRYQPVTYDLISRSGNQSEFADMVRRCNKAGVGIYADAVINHIASGSGTSISGKPYGNRATPIYTADDMHHNDGDDSKNCQITNYQNKWNVQYCDLVGLPDLCTACKGVQSKIADYINNMKSIGIAGIRIDAAKHQDAGELGGIVNRVKDNLFIFQEVIAGAGEAVTPEMYTSLGKVTEFNFANTLSPNFNVDGKLQYLSTFGESWGLMKSDDAVTFLDNHDTQRHDAILTYKSGNVYQLANIFMLATPYGYPKVMSSYDFNNADVGPPSFPVHQGGKLSCAAPMQGVGQGGWICEHRWPAIANMIAWRNSAGTETVTNFQSVGADTIAFCRGTKACLAMNRGNNAWQANVKFTVPAGRYCNVIASDDTSNCPVVEVNNDGSVSFQVPAIGAVAVHVGVQPKEVIVLN
mmetsp:Transcript_444/g.1026  ORF Transcript_444/g.1026 Transcript_444/m.1026 type:complete len:508 (-) Transcript_444:114-1637(-)